MRCLGCCCASQGRPLSLKRYPNGIKQPFFFQKNTPEGYPAWLRTEQIEDIRYVLAQDKASLLYLTNLVASIRIRG